MFTVEERYWAKVGRGGPDECWPWTASCSPGGYGKFRDEDGNDARAHRWAYKHFVGPVPDDILVCHSCDNPPCQNPAHWFLGPSAANSADMVAKGRSYQGPKPWKSKLTSEQVAEIREKYRGKQHWRRSKTGPTMKELSVEYGVTELHLGKILRSQVRVH